MLAKPSLVEFYIQSLIYSIPMKLSDINTFRPIVLSWIVWRQQQHHQQQKKSKIHILHSTSLDYVHKTQKWLLNWISKWQWELRMYVLMSLFVCFHSRRSLGASEWRAPQTRLCCFMRRKIMRKAAEWKIMHLLSGMPFPSSNYARRIMTHISRNEFFIPKWSRFVTQK